MPDIVADNVIIDSSAAASGSESLTKTLNWLPVVFHKKVGLRIGLHLAEFFQEFRSDRNTAPCFGFGCEDPNTLVLPVHVFPFEGQQFAQTRSYSEVHADFDGPLNVRNGGVMNLLEIFRIEDQLLGKLFGLLPFAERILGEVDPATRKWTVS